MYCVFFFKQKTAYEMRISDWSSDVCSSDLRPPPALVAIPLSAPDQGRAGDRPVVGQVAQALLFVLTQMLAGVLLSNFIEEKANKVIEVLAAAAPMRSEERRVGNECVSKCR